MRSSADPDGNRGETDGDLRQRVERCEEILRGFGIRRFRIRARGAAARIEAEPEEVPRLFGLEVAEAVHVGFRRNGFLFVSVDYDGCRAGATRGGEIVEGPPDPDLL